MVVPAYVALQVQSQRPCVCPRSWGEPLWGGLSKEKLMGEGLGGICSSGPAHQGGEAVTLDEAARAV